VKRHLPTTTAFNTRLNLHAPIDQSAARRDFLRAAFSRTASLGLGTLLVNGLSGCVSTLAPSLTPRPISSLPFARPDIRISEATRIRVGLRPFRPSGFVVRADDIGDKCIVHNYGHGGAGITLSWGTAEMAADALQASQPNPHDKNVAIIGAGVIGLTTARILQERGFAVTLYAATFSPNNTSDIAGGQFAPTGTALRQFWDDAFNARLNLALTKSHARFVTLIGKGYGVNWRENYHLIDPARNNQAPSYLSDVSNASQLFPHAALLRRGEHPFPANEVLRFSTLLIEPPIFLPRLTADVLAAGGKIIERRFANITDVMSLTEKCAINCTGLGAARLFGDTELTPVRGQIVIVDADARVDYLTHGGGEGLLYMFPRADGIVLGGTYERGSSDLRDDAETTARIVREHQQLFVAMRV
jgi:D-amino-acid oxidase